jgi:hypothetical protein
VTQAKILVVTTNAATGNSPHFISDACTTRLLYTYTAMTQDGAWDFLNVMPYTVADADKKKLKGLLLLDGNANAQKLSLSNVGYPFLKRAGLPACTAADAILTSGHSSENYPAGTYEFAITFCNRWESDVLDPSTPPGIESNYCVAGELTTNGTSDEVLLRFDYPASADEQTVTHVRVYRRDTAAGHSWWRAIGYFATDAAYQETGDGLTEDSVHGAYDDYLVMPGPRMGDASDYLYATEASGQNTWDWAPSRNYQPQNLHYGVIHDNRAFYAALDKHEIWYTDSLDPFAGGHVEHIVPIPLRVSNGPISMLAVYHDELVVGTPNTIRVMRGTFITNTNAGVGRGEIHVDPGIVFDDTEATIGPLRGGTGSWVVANDKLWFITREGLAYFDGTRVVVVNRSVRDLMLVDEDDFTPDPTRHNNLFDDESPFRRSRLLHDKERAMIFMDVHEYGDWDGLDGDWTGRGSVWCYAYLEADPEPNRDAEGQAILGSWTPFRSIGGRFANYASRQITAMAMMQRDDQPRRGQVAVGMIVWNATSGKFEGGGIWREVHSSSDDSENDSSGGETWIDLLALMGIWDDGLPDRKKKVFAGYAFVEAGKIAPQIAVLMNGTGHVSGVQDNDRGYIRTRVGASGRQAQVMFSGPPPGAPIESATARIIGYGLDRKPLGQIR